MRILADENIPLLNEFFAEFGEIRRLPGRAFTREAVADADVLLVRSVTNVNAALLEGSPVRFVGTCTIGTDHLDTAFMAQTGISWASAPGCNARGVVDYVMGALLALAEIQGCTLAERTFGVVGAGAVGSRLVTVLKRLGLRVLVCDPPRQQREGGDFVSLEEILACADVISLHTPLTKTGAEATYHLFDAARLAQLKAGCWLINASRGAVVDNAALRTHLEHHPDLAVVLDVWEGEPAVDVALAKHCRLVTPHIAGYSLDGKLRGTALVYQAFCAWRNQAETVQLADLLPPNWLESMQLRALPGQPLEWLLAQVCRAVYDPRTDDAAFRRTLQLPEESARRQAFDALRKHYPMRREIPGLSVQLVQHDNAAIVSALDALGVAVC